MRFLIKNPKRFAAACGFLVGLGMAFSLPTNRFQKGVEFVMQNVIESRIYYKEEIDQLDLECIDQVFYMRRHLVKKALQERNNIGELQEFKQLLQPIAHPSNK